jgi:hypothetical protein
LKICTGNGSGGLVCDEDKKEKRFRTALGEYSRKLMMIAAQN